MPWIQLKISATEETAEAISDMLSGNGAQAVTFQDAQDQPIYEPLPGEVKLWQQTIVTGLFDAEHNMDRVLHNLSQSKILQKDFTYKLDQLEDKDWEREWMENFHPMQFGQRLWICPSWKPVPDPDAVNILLDPGLAFGTGTHPTTAMCLEWLDGLDLTGKTVVDFGCGSGVLAVAALKLGASRVIGIDIDPQAIIASEDNAKRNGVEGQLELYLPENQPQFEADVVVANILAGPLKSLSEVILGYCKPGGKIALSGILETQVDDISQCYAKTITLDQPGLQEGWARVSGIKT